MVNLKALIRDRERNRTSPNRWIPRPLLPNSILSNDIETHGASTISTPCHAVSNERGSQLLPSFSTYYYTESSTLCQDNS